MSIDLDEAISFEEIHLELNINIELIESLKDKKVYCYDSVFSRLQFSLDDLTKSGIAVPLLRRRVWPYIDPYEGPDVFRSGLNHHGETFLMLKEGTKKVFTGSFPHPSLFIQKLEKDMPKYNLLDIKAANNIYTAILEYLKKISRWMHSLEKMNDLFPDWVAGASLDLMQILSTKESLTTKRKGVYIFRGPPEYEDSTIHWKLCKSGMVAKTANDEVCEKVGCGKLHWYEGENYTSWYEKLRKHQHTSLPLISVFNSVEGNTQTLSDLDDQLHKMYENFPVDCMVSISLRETGDSVGSLDMEFRHKIS
jgi:hypothetical protein